MNGIRRGIIGSVMICFFSGIIHADEPYWIRGIPTEPRNFNRRTASPVDLNEIPRAWQEALRKVMIAPTLTTQAGPDRFHVNDEFYRWLLDHPDRVGLAWKRLGVPAVDIRSLGNGRFAWSDEHGSELTWFTVGQSEHGRIWYAEGKVKPGPLMPLIPVKAVAILRHEFHADSKGRMSVRHSLEAYLQTESKFAAMVTRMLGPAAPRLAEQAADQLLYYFSGVARRADANPDKAESWLAPASAKESRR